MKTSRYNVPLKTLSENNASYQSKKRWTQFKQKEDFGKLKSVIGITASNKTNFVVDKNGLIAYPAGAVVVLYNPKNNSQVKFFQTQNPKPISAICFSEDSNYLAVAESGTNPCINIWDVQNQKIISKLSGHKFGVQSVIFSPNQQYLVSLGVQHDGNIFVWNWKTETRILSNKLSTKINSISFSTDSSYFVTCGKNHLKYWYLDSLKLPFNGTQSLEGKTANLGKFRNNNFVDVVCGKGEYRNLIFVVTFDGSLISMDNSREIQEIIDLKVLSICSIHITEEFIICGCSEGVIKIFNLDDLTHSITLPKPTLNSNLTETNFPEVVTVHPYNVNQNNMKVVALYSDKRVFVWDIKDSIISKYRSFYFHQSCIWDLKNLPQCSESSLSEEKMISCSSDGTILIWDMNLIENLSKLDEKQTIISTLDSQKSTKFDGVNFNSKRNEILCMQTCNNCDWIVCGDREGNLRIYSSKDYQQLYFLEAHDHEILSISMTETEYPDIFLLATAGRDRLIQVFEISKEIKLIQTLDDHSSSVNSLTFAFQGTYLISSSTDKTIRFRKFNKELNLFESFHSNIFRSNIHNLNVNHFSNTLLLTQEKKINVFDLHGNILQSLQSDEDLSSDWNLNKIQVDSICGNFGLLSSSDKKIRIYDLTTGESISFPSGHSEQITGLCFTNDCKKIISSSADGCIFVWELPQEILNVLSMSQGNGDENESGNENIQTFLTKVSQKGNLPLWAKSKIELTHQPLEPLKNEIPIVRGKWAEKIDKQGIKILSQSKENVNPISIECSPNIVKRRYTIEPDSSFQKEPESKDNRKIEILEKNEKEQLQCTELDLMESSFQDSEILDNFELLTPSLGKITSRRNLTSTCFKKRKSDFRLEEDSEFFGISPGLESRRKKTAAEIENTRKYLEQIGYNYHKKQKIKIETLSNSPKSPLNHSREKFQDAKDREEIEINKEEKVEQEQQQEIERVEEKEELKDEKEIKICNKEASEDKLKLQKETLYVLDRINQMRLLFDSSLDLYLQIREDPNEGLNEVIGALEGTIEHIYSRIECLFQKPESDPELEPANVKDRLERIELLVQGLYQ